MKRFLKGLAKVSGAAAITFLATHYGNGHFDNPLNVLHRGELIGAVLTAVALFVKSPLSKE